MTNPYIRRIAKAIVEVWSSNNKTTDMDQATTLFEPSAIAAINELITMIDEQHEPAYDFLLRIQKGSLT